MTICPVCGLGGVAVICPHHSVGMGDDWHVQNRIWCDLIHRGVQPLRLTKDQLGDDWTMFLREEGDG